MAQENIPLTLDLNFTEDINIYGPFVIIQFSPNGNELMERNKSAMIINKMKIPLKQIVLNENKINQTIKLPLREENDQISMP